MANSTGLTGDATTLGISHDINIAHVIAGNRHRLLEIITKRLRLYILFKLNAIYCPRALALDENYTSGCGFTTTGSGGNCFYCCHFIYSPLP